MTSISIGETRARAERRERAGQPRHYDGQEPWARRDIAAVAVVLVRAVVGLVVGWLGVSDTVDLDGQTRWLGFGIAALILGGFGMVGWLLVGLGRVARLRREVLAELTRRHPEPVTADWQVTTHQASVTVNFGTVPGMRRYHRADCQLLAGKQGTYAATADHEKAGLAPCPICLPADHEGVGS
jgi:fatty acid desaturase